MKTITLTLTLDEMTTLHCALNFVSDNHHSGTFNEMCAVIDEKLDRVREEAVESGAATREEVYSDLSSIKERFLSEPSA